MRNIVKTIKLSILAVAVCLLPLSLLLSASAYIGDFDSHNHQPPIEDASTALMENGHENDVLEFGATSYPYNAYVSNAGSGPIYAFVEFNCKTVQVMTDDGSAVVPLYSPVAGSGWVLYDDSQNVEINGESYRQMIFAYSSEARI